MYGGPDGNMFIHTGYERVNGIQEWGMYNDYTGIVIIEWSVDDITLLKDVSDSVNEYRIGEIGIKPDQDQLSDCIPFKLNGNEYTILLYIMYMVSTIIYLVIIMVTILSIDAISTSNKSRKKATMIVYVTLIITFIYWYIRMYIDKDIDSIYVNVLGLVISVKVLYLRSGGIR